ncbi:MAG: hypothetical protein CMH57_08450 [Myxococcales bacterium]|nr:hypothetical protein [Myxococcales bacterium]
MVVTLVAALCAVASGQAQAQDVGVAAEDEPLPRGLYVGQLQLHPGLFIEGGYDSNVFFEDDSENPSNATKLNGVIKLGVETPRPKKAQLDLEVGLTYSELFAEEQAIQNQSGVTAFGRGTLLFNPNGSVAVGVFDYFRRTNEAPNTFSSATFNRFSNEAGGILKIQPGGKLLTLDLEGSYAVVRNGIVDDLDHNIVRLGAQGKWKFLPKTAFVLVASQRFINYEQSTRDTVNDNIPEDSLANINSSPLRVEGGLNGLIFTRISATAMIGYGNSFYEDGPSFSGLIGRAEAGYEIGPTSQFRLGYHRNFEDSSFGNYATFHRVFARYNHLIGGIFNLRLEGTYTLRQFAPVANPILLGDVMEEGAPARRYGNSNPDPYERVDPLYGAEAEGTFRVFDIWRVGGRYQLTVNDTDFFSITGQGDLFSPGRFVKHEAYLTTGVEW